MCAILVVATTLPVQLTLCIAPYSVSVHSTVCVCIVYSLCLYCVQSVSVLCTVCVCTVYSLCLYCVQSVSVLCTVCVCTVYSLYLYCVQSVSVLLYWGVCWILDMSQSRDSTLPSAFSAIQTGFRCDLYRGAGGEEGGTSQPCHL